MDEWKPNGLVCYDHEEEDGCELPCPACAMVCDPSLTRPKKLLTIWCVFFDIEYDAHSLVAVYDNEAAAKEDQEYRARTARKPAGESVDVEEWTVQSHFSIEEAGL